MIIFRFKRNGKNLHGTITPRKGFKVYYFDYETPDFIYFVRTQEVLC
jgi:hypothetical protein